MTWIRYSFFWTPQVDVLAGSRLPIVGFTRWAHFRCGSRNQNRPCCPSIYRFPLNKFLIPTPRFSILSYSPANQNTFPCQCPSLLTDTKKAALLPVWSWWEIGCFHREPSSKNLNPQCQKQDLPSQMNYREWKLGCNRTIKCTFKCHF